MSFIGNSGSGHCHRVPRMTLPFQIVDNAPGFVPAAGASRAKGLEKSAASGSMCGAIHPSGLLPEA
jgi:hypothetical protein